MQEIKKRIMLDISDYVRKVMENRVLAFERWGEEHFHNEIEAAKTTIIEVIENYLERWRDELLRKKDSTDE